MEDLGDLYFKIKSTKFSQKLFSEHLLSDILTSPTVGYKDEWDTKSKEEFNELLIQNNPFLNKYLLIKPEILFGYCVRKFSVTFNQSINKSLNILNIVSNFKYLR